MRSLQNANMTATQTFCRCDFPHNPNLYSVHAKVESLYLLKMVKVRQVLQPVMCDIGPFNWTINYLKDHNLTTTIAWPRNGYQPSERRA